MRYLFIIFALVFCIFITPTYGVSQSKNYNVQGGGTVVGTGSTYQEAFQDARSKIPAGKSHYRVTSRKSTNGTWYVTLYYRG